MSTPAVSPFPGMDPYLEVYWRDVHPRLIALACDQLSRLLCAETLHVCIGVRRTAMSFTTGLDRPIAVLGRRGAKSRHADGPLVIRANPSRTVPTEPFIQILDPSDDNRPVTVIELLTPTIKGTGVAAKRYHRRQQKLRDHGVNLVEIDLTRAGHRQFIVPLHEVPPSHRTTFGACVYRARAKDSTFQLYPIPLDRPIPPIRIPLRPHHAEVKLDLQPLLARIYRKGSFGDIDYGRPPHPPLSDADAASAGQLLAGQFAPPPPELCRAPQPHDA